MSKRRWPVGSFVPCSPRHHHCSPAHAALVRGYREERERQETANEMILTNKAERELWKANGGSLITFKTWLIENKTKTNRSQMSDETCIVKPATNTPDHTSEIGTNE